MKIINLRFKNLNSLHGEWKIDFTAPEYVSDGIFAITGPTGAGKSTILDAICLALYGRTPRLKSITGSVNEIMSRQTGECFSEVVFETPKGRFRCIWSQTRARRKPDGKLQDAKHDISDDETGKVIESQKRHVLEAIIERTGMDFDQFTRSILLAQGGFAAFLQASPDERAPILEDITGTEIYTEISVRVHQRQREEREKLERLDAETKGIRIFDEQEIARLKDDLTEKQDQEKKQASDNAGTLSAMNWLKAVSGLENELASLEHEAEKISSEITAFDNDRKRLIRAVSAAGLEGKFVLLDSKRKQQEEDLEAAGICNSQLPEKQAIFVNLEADFKKKETELAENRKNQNNESVIIKMVRALDLQIKEKEKNLESISFEIQSFEKQISDMLRKRQETEKKLSASQKDLEKAVEYITANACDENLVSESAAIKKTASDLEESIKKRASLNEKIEKSLKQIKSASSEVEKFEKKSAMLRLDAEAAKAESVRLSESLAKLLEGREVRLLRAENEGLGKQLKHTETAIELFSTLESDFNSLKEAESSKTVISEKITSNRADTVSLTEKKELHEKEIRLLEEKAALLNRIRDLESERLRLEDGKPCPLCGSVHHPYAEGNVPETGDAEKELAAAKSVLEETVRKISQLDIQTAGFSSDLEHLDQNIKSLSIAIAGNTAKFNENLVPAGIITASDALDDSPEISLSGIPAYLLSASVLPEAIGPHEAPAVSSISKDKLFIHKTSITEKISIISEIITKAEQLEAVIKNASINERDLFQASADGEKTLLQAIHKKEALESEYERDKTDLQQIDDLAAVLKNDFLLFVNKYGFTEIPDAGVDIILDNLDNRLKKWQKIQKVRSDADKRINELSLEMKGMESSVKAHEENLRSRKTELESTGNVCSDLKKDRSELYGDRNPDHEERRMNLLVSGAEENLKQAVMKRDEAGRAVHELNTRINDLSVSIENRRKEIIGLEEAFISSLGNAAFRDEADFMSSRMQSQERNSLAEAAKQLDTRQAEIKARICDRREKLDFEKDKKITEKTIEELESEYSLSSEELKNLSHEIGALKQRLADNESAAIQYREIQIRSDSQRTELARWSDLHELIGSADGKKFRNFAQGLTFEIMVSHANRQLEKMTDRYLLTRDSSQPLELNVVDNYQAGEIRSTRNLSGGESFIVSLALALGLSAMASRKVRVDSLFLDEGFGTLDEEALETALETLAGLQSTGKLIGIISHVSALKERIGTRIHVKPVTGGRSVISGPGCIKRPAA